MESENDSQKLLKIFDLFFAIVIESSYVLELKIIVVMRLGFENLKSTEFVSHEPVIDDCDFDFAGANYLFMLPWYFIGWLFFSAHETEDGSE